MKEAPSPHPKTPREAGVRAVPVGVRVVDVESRLGCQRAAWRCPLGLPASSVASRRQPTSPRGLALRGERLGRYTFKLGAKLITDYHVRYIMGAGSSTASGAGSSTASLATFSDAAIFTVIREIPPEARNKLRTAVDSRSGTGNSTPSLAERIAAPIHHPHMWEETVQLVQACKDTLTLPMMCELSAALLEVPGLTALQVGTRELIACHRNLFEREGSYTESLREHLRREKEERLAGPMSRLGEAEKRALLDAVSGCANDEHRVRVRSAIGTILSGDVSALQLDESLASDVPPALEQLGKLAELRLLDLTRNQLVVPECEHCSGSNSVANPMRACLLRVLCVSSSLSGATNHALRADRVDRLWPPPLAPSLAAV